MAGVLENIANVLKMLFCPATCQCWRVSRPSFIQIISLMVEMLAETARHRLEGSYHLGVSENSVLSKISSMVSLKTGKCDWERMMMNQ